MTYFKYCNDCGWKIPNAGKQQRYCNKCQEKRKNITQNKNKETYKKKRD